MADGIGSNAGSVNGSASASDAAAAAARGKSHAGVDLPESSATEGVATMMGRLRLMAKESKTFVLADDIVEDYGFLEWAIVGKVLAPNTLHVETIKAIIKPAWGNPKGMKVRSLGPNIFLAELSSKIDMQRIMNGSPWVVGNNAILLKEFDPRVDPADVVFDRLLLGVRIYKPPYPLMNVDRGTPLAAMLGEVDHLDVDENG
ncbi:hypothetical protein ACQ4PT_031130 [Festuca glaucescens]